MRLMTSLLFCMMIFAIWSALSRAPAFNPEVRADTVLGDWRVPLSSALYDPSAYAFQRGYGFLMADVLFSADTEARGEVAPTTLAKWRALQALSALETAVSLNPGNAHAWAQLAWAHARMADDAAALEALRVSWRLAPYNRALADTRINLVGLLSDPSLQIVTLSPDDLAALAADAGTLSRFDRPALAFYRDQLPHLPALNAEARK